MVCNEVHSEEEEGRATGKTEWDRDKDERNSSETNWARKPKISQSTWESRYRRNDNDWSSQV